MNNLYLISGGGTGGHIFPALAIADGLKLRNPSSQIVFVGALGKMEMKRIPEAGYKIHGLWISGLQRAQPLKNLLFPLKIMLSLVQCISLLLKYRPKAVVGTGGFASGPLLFAASWLGFPTLIQEQNSYPGITNKLLGRRAKKICVAYDGLESFFPKNKIILTGNPIRKDLIQAQKNEETQKSFGLIPHRPTVLILGGSLGSKAINKEILKNLDYFQQNKINLIWPCGKLYYGDLMQKVPREAGIYLKPFIAEIDQAYLAADVVIARAGAGSLSELAAMGKACILIPSPNVAEDHQTKNALAFVKKEAALLVKETEISNLLDALQELLNAPEMRKKLETNILKLAMIGATESIVNEILSLKK